MNKTTFKSFKVNYTFRLVECCECTFTFSSTNNLFKRSVLDTHLTRAPFYASPILICKTQKFSHFTFHFTYINDTLFCLFLCLFPIFFLKSLIAAFTFDVQKVEWNSLGVLNGVKNKTTPSRDILEKKRFVLRRCQCESFKFSD